MAAFSGALEGSLIRKGVAGSLPSDHIGCWCLRQCITSYVATLDLVALFSFLLSLTILMHSAWSAGLLHKHVHPKFQCSFKNSKNQAVISQWLLQTIKNFPALKTWGGCIPWCWGLRFCVWYQHPLRVSVQVLASPLQLQTPWQGAWESISRWFDLSKITTEF